MNRIRVLIVDDSKFIRMALRKALEGAEDVEILGEARDGEEAVRFARQLKPDLITMDIVMPGMDGITAIREILSFMNVPIIVISDHTTQGAKVTFEALDAGAVDFIPKGSKELKLDLSR
ncbi:MAG: response regulator, partial [Aquificota bacterium]